MITNKVTLNKQIILFAKTNNTKVNYLSYETILLMAPLEPREVSILYSG